MARTQVDSNGLAAATSIGLSSNTTGVSEYDVFVSNQGEGAMRVTVDWTAADFSSVFIPPSAHRPARDLSPGDVLVVDTNTAIQIVAFRVTTDPAASANITFTGQKAHVTGASTGNDYLTVGSGLR